MTGSLKSEHTFNKTKKSRKQESACGIFFQTEYLADSGFSCEHNRCDTNSMRAFFLCAAMMSLQPLHRNVYYGFAAHLSGIAV